MTTIPQTTWAPDTTPVVVIELQDLIGPQPDTGYVDITGIPPGRYQCETCTRSVIVANHACRPWGAQPVILDARRHMQGPWRVYAKRDNPDTYFATFEGDASEHAHYINHRIVCPTAKVKP